MVTHGKEEICTLFGRKGEDLKRVFCYVQKLPREHYSGVLFEQDMCLCLKGPST